MTKMNEITRKQIRDVIVPQNDLMRRPVVAPEPTLALIPKIDGADRIERNPFFEKERRQTSEPKNIKKSGMRGVLWALLFVLFLVLAFVVANYFESATITVSPVSKNIVLDSKFTADKEEVSGELMFQLMSLTEEKTKEVPATIEKSIQKKASGRVVIYNNYSADSQRLIKNTRLESPDRKIFRIEDSVVVPGIRIVGGKSTPGSVEALVYADVAGKEYNIGTSNFTIPGFKGDPRYTKFYASSKVDAPIGGGFSGTIKVPTDEVVSAAREELKQELKKTTIEKARAQIPESKTFFPGSMVLKFEEVPEEYSSDKTAKVAMRATVSVFFFDTVALTDILASRALPEEKNIPFTVSNMSTLDFKFTDAVENLVPSDLSKIKFHLRGETKFIGNIDVEKIRTELLGKDKKDFSKIITSQNTIDTADAVIRPMWKTVFPTDPTKVTVKIGSK
ncbi:MAG: hypothetical protein Q7K40_02915 [bacterium]|nr:hypothetical protein [bacterium]